MIDFQNKKKVLTSNFVCLLYYCFYFSYNKIENAKNGYSGIPY